MTIIIKTLTQTRFVRFALIRSIIKVWVTAASIAIGETLAKDVPLCSLKPFDSSHAAGWLCHVDVLSWLLRSYTGVGLMWPVENLHSAKSVVHSLLAFTAADIKGCSVSTGNEKTLVSSALLELRLLLARLFWNQIFTWKTERILYESFVWMMMIYMRE